MYGCAGPTRTWLKPSRPSSRSWRITESSAGRSISQRADPCWASSSKPSEFAWPVAIRDTEKVPIAPEVKWALKAATSSFSTGSMTSLSCALE
jgi:hypothetical protein